MIETLNPKYQEMVIRLAKPGQDILKNLTPETCELLHAAIGISSDGGEFLDAVKAHVIYGKPLDRENIIEELGDLEWFMQLARNCIRVTREEIIQANVNKLAKRYPDKVYSDKDGLARKDKENE